MYAFTESFLSLYEAVAKAEARAEASSAKKKSKAKHFGGRQPKSRPEQRHGQASATATKASYSVEDYMTKVNLWEEAWELQGL